MKKTVTATAWFMILAVACLASAPLSVESLPPVVVQSIPVSGDLSVDPTLTEIRVTFSKEMQTAKMWSWVQVSAESFPKVNGEVHYLADKRTCVMPVKLEPGKTYVIWVNSESHNAFRDAQGNSAVPYLIAFRTRS